MNDVDAIDRRIEAKKDKAAKEGRIVSFQGRIAKVQAKGSSRTYPVHCDDSQQIDVGKRCLFQWFPDSKKYVMITVFTGTGVSGNSPQQTYELFPPGNVQAVSNILPDAFELRWNVPPQQPVVFEVQTNTSAVDSGATTVGTTRGGGIIVYTTDPLYARARSIAQNFQKSAWSAWVSGTPGEADSGSGGAETFLELTDVPSSYGSQSGKLVAVKSAEDGLEFISPSGPGVEAFTDLSDAPASYSGQEFKFVRVNDAEDGLEFADFPGDGDAIHISVADEYQDAPLKNPPSGADFILIEDASDGNAKKYAQIGNLPFAETFLELPDAPASYTSQGLKLVRVNAAEDALEFTTPLDPGAENFTDLSDVPAAYSGQGEKLVAVKSDESGLEFITAPSGGAGMYRLQYIYHADDSYSDDDSAHEWLSSAADIGNRNTPAMLLVEGDILRFHFWGYLSTEASGSPAVNFEIDLNGSPIHDTWDAVLDNSLSGVQWHLFMECRVTTAGSSGEVLSMGELRVGSQFFNLTPTWNSVDTDSSNTLTFYTTMAELGASNEVGLWHGTLEILHSTVT